MNKKTLIILVIITIVLISGLYFLYLFRNGNTVVVNVPGNTSVIYNNADYGFNFSLPDDWNGYSIIKNTWKGNALTSTPTNETGPTLLIRNPKWTEIVHYEDIPIMIFTLTQWKSYLAEDFAVSAAPIQASELARNNLYVFALPPRWDFDYSKGYEEAENILKMNPLKAFDVTKVSILKDGQQCYTYSHEATKTEPYTVSEFINLMVNGKIVTGTKKGSQNGPDMTNGYTGTITGTTDGNVINDVFSYIIEGSPNKEAEIYRAREDQIGIEKLRYPLIEKNKMLVPDTTKEFKTMLYARVICTGSN